MQQSVTVRKFTQEQQITLVTGCAASGLNIRQYAALNNVSLSALTKWSIKFGISLRKWSGRCSQTDQLSENLEPITKTDGTKTSGTINANASEFMNQGFSFIDITDCSPGAKPQARPETPLSGLEIRMPNGVQLKIDHIPFETLWPQVLECAKVLGGI